MELKLKDVIDIIKYPIRKIEEYREKRKKETRRYEKIKQEYERIKYEKNNIIHEKDEIIEQKMKQYVKKIE